MVDIAVPLFALTWWSACFLVGRDPARRATWRAAAALATYALGVVVWTWAPEAVPAQILLCVPALFWGGAAVALLPDALPERRQIDLGWRVLSVASVVALIVLPPVGRLVVLAVPVGGLVLLWRFRDQVRPPMLPGALSVAAALYGVALAALLLPLDLDLPDLDRPDLVLAAIGLDLLMLGFLVAVAEALEVGERLRPDLRRAALAAAAAVLLAGGPAVLTIQAARGDHWVLALQFVLVGVVMTLVGLAGPIHRRLDGVAFAGDERLRAQRSELLLLADALPRHRQPHRLITTSEADFVRFTRQALDNFYRPGRLMRSPLTDLPAVDHWLAGSTANPPPTRALALRAVLADGVDRLRPPGPFSTGDDWRHYIALRFSSVLGLDPYSRRLHDGLDQDALQALDWMRRYVPRRVLRRWQIEGAAVLAGRLWDELMSTDPRWLTRQPANRR
jgi:hypothetical protein